MKDIPAKLEKYISNLEENKRQEKLDLFSSLYDRAKNNNFQNARHWAMRQVLSERSVSEIERKFVRLENKLNRRKT